MSIILQSLSRSFFPPLKMLSIRPIIQCICVSYCTLSASLIHNGPSAVPVWSCCPWAPSKSGLCGVCWKIQFSPSAAPAFAFKTETNIDLTLWSSVKCYDEIIINHCKRPPRYSEFPRQIIPEHTEHTSCWYSRAVRIQLRTTDWETGRPAQVHSYSIILCILYSIWNSFGCIIGELPTGEFPIGTYRVLSVYLSICLDVYFCQSQIVSE